MDDYLFLCHGRLGQNCYVLIEIILLWHTIRKNLLILSVSEGSFFQFCIPNAMCFRLNQIMDILAEPVKQLELLLYK